MACGCCCWSSILEEDDDDDDDSNGKELQDENEVVVMKNIDSTLVHAKWVAVLLVLDDGYTKTVVSATCPTVDPRNRPMAYNRVTMK
jgi:hypothetical protein